MNNLARICREVQKNKHITQRELAHALDISLGKVNHYIRQCVKEHYIEVIKGNYFLTYKGNEFLSEFQVDNALIIAAGFGSRFVPLTFDTPKGLLEVNGERMIERMIRQLNEKEIYDITIVVGYLKEKFDYLIDKYGVKLLYNPDYSKKNNLSTLYRARHLLKNTYVLCSDHWMSSNLFNRYECGTWYSCVYQEGKTSEWCVQADKKKRITKVTIGGYDSLAMLGPAFFSREFSKKLVPLLEEYYQRPGTEQLYWENVYIDHLDELEMYINEQSGDVVYEFENLEELRQFDKTYQNFSNNEAMSTVSRILEVPEGEIRNISCLKAGMTNKSFVFTVQDKDYIFRIPGQGTDQLINRMQEGEVYQAIAPLEISDQMIRFDSRTGYKLSRFYRNSRNTDSQTPDDVKKSMELLRKVHESGIEVDHSFDIAERIDFYEKLCMEKQCIAFYDYSETRQKMRELLRLLEQIPVQKSLCHIDSVPDNFIVLENGGLKLLDWEYAGMCDPLIDVAMYAIYSYYDEQQTDQLIRIYLQREPEADEIVRIYSYIALGGFLWALWTEYKQSLGDEFGEYGMKMYRYAKDYYKKLQK